MNRKLSKYAEIASFLGKVLPEEYETVLLDLTVKGMPVIEQTNWASQDIRAIRKYVAGLISEGADKEYDYLTDRVLPGSKDHISKIGVLFIKTDGMTIGALCINADMSLFMRLDAYLRRMMTYETGADSDVHIHTGDVGDMTVSELSDISRIVKEFGTDPSDMTPSERKEVFMDLYDAGAFRLRGSIPAAAEAIGISEKSVYRYLSEIKKARK